MLDDMNFNAYARLICIVFIFVINLVIMPMFILVVINIIIMIVLECVLRPSKPSSKIIFSHSIKLSQDAKPVRV